MTLEELRRMKPGPGRVQAIGDYIEQGEMKIREARHLRDEDVRALVASNGLAKTARDTGLSLSTVKAIRGRP